LENEIEPTYRKYNGYPPDWERRRALVFIKDQGECQKCRKSCGHLACEPNQIWNFKFDEHLLYDADVHHAKHKSSAGNHGLDNLLLYCLLCHSKEHPENSDIRPLPHGKKTPAGSE
jgi:5-methylcytosine-specific restriction endonuclease McrA